MAEAPGISKSIEDASNGTSAPLAVPAFSPLYRQIKGLLLQSLQSGQWQPGEAIPSEMELAQQLRVSQGTVRKAIDELAAEHLLVRKQGKGTFVATHTERHVQYRFLRLRPDAGGLDEEGPAQRHILHCRRLRANAEMAQQLALRSGDAVIHIRRTLSMQGTPTVLEDIWLPAHAFKGISAAQITDYQGPTYALLEKEYGVRMIRANEKLKAIACADEATAALLQVAVGTPLLSVERTTYTYNDVPMEVRRGVYRTDTHHYHNEIN
ncbi:GntR family transcriptional regulator [Corticibacter populi]|uniref:GntR family transcriptional regulator n=1 Tax=Corticibacter populi TaxID=1550736 RepID=A0A3M6QV97_9BURK|nr:GntR family transcriptional regulator [Corticibacter populi]RMX06412.1 GntR family transcriptional regulator [Corticibacter populi]RZS32041.1 GntR family transcriptional regulator [Corticibacter populi]